MTVPGEEFRPTGRGSPGAPQAPGAHGFPRTPPGACRACSPRATSSGGISRGTAGGGEGWAGGGPGPGAGAGAGGGRECSRAVARVTVCPAVPRWVRRRGSGAGRGGVPMGQQGTIRQAGTPTRHRRSPCTTLAQSSDTFHLPPSSSAASSPGGSMGTPRAATRARQHKTVTPPTHGFQWVHRVPLPWDHCHVAVPGGALHARACAPATSSLPGSHPAPGCQLLCQPGNPGAVPLPLDPQSPQSVLQMACELPQRAWDEIIVDVLRPERPRAELRYALHALAVRLWRCTRSRAQSCPSCTPALFALLH